MYPTNPKTAGFLKPSGAGFFARRLTLRRWAFILCLLLCALAAAPILLLAGDASAQDPPQSHISVKSPSASATNTHGEVQQVKIKEGENLTFTFAIREARRAGTATFAYEFREERPTRDAIAGADFEAASGTITVTGDATADAQPQKTLTVTIPWEWGSGHTDLANEGFSLRLHALNTGDNILFQNRNRNELVIPIIIEDRKPPITVNAGNGRPANGASGTEKWSLTGGLDPDVGKIAFEIRIPAPADAATTPTVDYAITPGTANANDYAFDQGRSASGTISFRGTPGGLDGTSSTSRTYTLYVSPVNDNFVEQAETLNLTLSNPSDGLEFPDMNRDGTADTTLEVQGVIEPDDTVGATAANVTVTEGNVATVMLSLTRSLVANESASISVGVRPAESCTTASGAHAVAGLDYRVPASMTLVFGPGDSSKSFRVQTLEDITDEQTECLLVSYYAPQGILVTAGTDQITPTAKEPGATWVKVKIEDDDDAPTLSFPNNTVGVVEPDEGGTATLTLEANLDVPSAKSVTVDYAHHFQGQGDEATSGTDFEAFQPGTLTFAPGETQKTLAITVKGDYVEEPDELLSVQFHSPENACFSTTGSCAGGGVTSYGLIRNNDRTVKLSFTVDDPTVREGDTAVVRFTLSRPIPYDVTATLATKDITATGGIATGDYGGRSSGFAITIPRGATTRTNTIAVYDDGESGEGRETFTWTFQSLFFLGFSPDNLTPRKQMFGANYTDEDIIASVTMPVVTIVDGPALSVEGVKDTVTEGQPVHLRATLSEPAANDVTFRWKTQDGGGDTDDSRTAVAGKDYTARAAQSATIPAGTTSIDLGTVQTLQDTVDEWGQQFSVVLESINGAQEDDTTAVITIRDDDTRPGLSVADAAADEGDALSFAVSLSAASEKEVMAHWLTEDDTATGVGYARDYQPMEQRQSLTFSPGETTKTITVQTVEDRKAEETERFKVQLLHAPNARFRDPTAIGTIRDDDRIEVSIEAPAPVTEGPSRNATFTVSIFPVQTSAVTIQWETADELNTGFYTAEAGKDYTAQAKTDLTFGAGQTRKTVSVPIRNDTDFEATETFRVLLSGDTDKFLFLSATAHGAIDDDDAYDLYAQTAWPKYIVEGDPGSGEIPVYTLNLRHDQLSADDASGWTFFHALRCELDVPAPLSHSYVGYLPPPGTLASQVTSWAGGDVEVGTGSNTFGGLSRCSEPRGETAYTTLRIPFDTREEQLYLRVRPDDTPENNERFTLWIIPNTGPWRVLGPDIAKHGWAYSIIIIDDDRPQATITGATVDEDDTSAQVTVALNEAASGSVSVFVETRDGTATAAQDYAHIRERVTFSAGETSKTVSVPLIADNRIEGDTETFFVFLDDASSGLNIDPRQEEAVVTINEASDIALTIPDRVVDEGDTMPVMFNLSDRLPDVTGWGIEFTVNTDFTGVSDPASAGDYDAAEWGTKTVQMAAGASGAQAPFAATEDTEVEGDEDIGLVINSFTSTRTLEYDGRRAGGSRYIHAPMVTIRDDDYNTVSISAYEDGVVRAGAEWTSSGTPTESGNPDGHVTWTLEGNDGGDFTIDSDTGVVTLPAQQFESPADHNGDNVYEAIVRATDEDGNSDTQPIKVSVNGRSLVISETSVTTAENDAATYTIELDSQPVVGDDVTVDITTKGTTAAFNLDKTQLTFTSANWDTAQTVTVTGVDDFLDNAVDPRTATIVHKSSGSGFTVSVEDEVGVSITDNDVAGVKFSVDTLTMNENGGTGSYDVTLTAQPKKAINVLVVATGTAGAYTLDKTSLTFQPADWNKPQTVTVTGVDDDVRNPDGQRQFTIVHWGPIAPGWGPAHGAAGQPHYPVSVILTDDDRSLVISETSVTVAENGGVATYTVKLDSQPVAGNDVTVDITTKGATAGFTQDKTRLTFTSANWDDAQTVTVTGVDDFLDNVANPRTATIVHKSTGSGLTVAAKEVAVAITDNDVAGITLSVDTLTMNENGGKGSYDVTLTAQPTEAINIFVIPTGVQGPVVVAPRTLTFQPADWNKPQTVSVTGMDDNKFNPGGERRFHIIHWGNIGPGWSSVDGSPGQPRYHVSITLTDDDARGVIVSKRIINVDATVAAGDTYTVKLKSQPNGGTVTVTPGSADKGTKINISPASLTFDNRNWMNPQTVTVTAIDDPDAAGLVSTITHAVSGADYGDVAAADVTAHVQFSRTGDTGGLRITVGEAATEGGAGVTFTVTRPDSSTDEFWWYIRSYSGDEPSADADDFERSDALDFHPSRGGKDNARILLFRSGNSQSFTVDIKDDIVDEETEYFIVSIKPVDSTSREDSTASDWRDAIGIIHDNDDPPTLSVADVTVAEEGKEAVFTATMSHGSSRDVTFKWKTADDTAGANPATAGDDYTAVSTARTVTIAAGDTTAELKVSITGDTEVEEDETFLVVLSEPTNAVLSATASTATGTITDNDVPGEFTLTVEGGSVKENQPYSERATITGNPVGDITWTLSGDDAALFTITPQQGDSKRATLSLPAQDHENPADKNKDRVYEVTVSATDEDDTVVSKNISVTVVNVTDFSFTIEELRSVAEGDPVSLKITLQGRPTSDANAGATLNWIIEPDGRDGAHPAGASDYGTPTSGTITWPYRASGDALTQTITIPTTEDTLDEHDETFIIRLKDAKAIASDDTVISEEPGFNLPSRVTNMTRDGVQVVVVVTIIDDFDAAAVVTVGAATAVDEGDDPLTPTFMSFPVMLDAASGRDVTVTYSVGGTATPNVDYFNPGSKELTIRAGATAGAIIIPVRGDVLDEADETVTVTLETATNARLHRLRRPSPSR